VATGPIRIKAVVEKYVGDDLLREEEISDSEDDFEIDPDLVGYDSQPDPQT
jgi:hypothetical protein